jgi:RNA polymerase sigma-70 factor (ECF subfamily)
MPDSDSDTIWALTSWGLVARAAEGGKEADTAWATLMERYREPVLRAGRRILRGHPATGQILEEFAGYVFEHGLVGRADPERGLFRCYIQGVVRRFVLDALKKRDARRAVEIEGLEVAATSEIDAGDQEESAWAEAVLTNAMRRYADEGTRDAEILLRFHGVAPYTPMGRDALCAEFDINANALNQALHRARRNLRRRILEEVRDTVRGPQDLHDEMTMVVSRLMEARPGLLGSDDT